MHAPPRPGPGKKNRPGPRSFQDCSALPCPEAIKMVPLHPCSDPPSYSQPDRKISVFYAFPNFLYVNVKRECRRWTNSFWFANFARAKELILRANNIDIEFFILVSKNVKSEFRRAGDACKLGPLTHSLQRRHSARPPLSPPPLLPSTPNSLSYPVEA